MSEPISAGQPALYRMRSKMGSSAATKSMAVVVLEADTRRGIARVKFGDGRKVNVQLAELSPMEEDAKPTPAKPADEDKPLRLVTAPLAASIGEQLKIKHAPSPVAPAKPEPAPTARVLRNRTVERIMLVRKLRAISRLAASRLLGVSAAAIHTFELSKFEPRAGTVARYAKAYQVPEDLLCPDVALPLELPPWVGGKPPNEAQKPGPKPDAVRVVQPGNASPVYDTWLEQTLAAHEQLEKERDRLQQEIAEGERTLNVQRSLLAARNVQIKQLERALH